MPLPQRHPLHHSAFAHTSSDTMVMRCVQVSIVLMLTMYRTGQVDRSSGGGLTSRRQCCRRQRRWSFGSPLRPGLVRRPCASTTSRSMGSGRCRCLTVVEPVLASKARSPVSVGSCRLSGTSSFADNHPVTFPSCIHLPIHSHLSLYMSILNT